MAWGRPWQNMSEGIIVEGDIYNDNTDSADDDEDSYLADKLRLSTPFHYVFFKNINHVTRAIGNENSALDESLVVREEYKILYRALENELKTIKDVVVTG